MKPIFISYKRADKDQVFKLIDKIEQTLGVKCWYDLSGIETGAQFPLEICNAIDDAKVVLFMHSKAHLGIDFQKDWTVKELNYAQMTDKRVVLVRLDDAPLRNIFLMEYGTRNNIDSQDPTQWNKLMNDLRHWLKLDTIQPTTNTPKPTKYSESELEELNRKGDSFYEKKQYSEAIECYRKAAEQGYALAQLRLGSIYRDGHGITKNKSQARYWFQKAADQGLGIAEEALFWL